MLSAPHLILVFLVALLVFGPEKLPELARNMSKWMAEFRRYSGDFQETIQREMRQLEQDAMEHKHSKSPSQLAPASSSGPSEAVTQHEDADPSSVAWNGDSPEGISYTQEDETANAEASGDAGSVDASGSEFEAYDYGYDDPYAGAETADGEGYDPEWQSESSDAAPAEPSEHATKTEASPDLDHPDAVKSSTEEQSAASAGAEHPFNDHPSAA